MESVKLLQSWMFLIWAFAEKIPYFLRTNLKMLPCAENCPNIWHWPGLCWSGRPEVNVNTNLLSFKRESFIRLCAACAVRGLDPEAESTPDTHTDHDSTSQFTYIGVWQSIQKTQFNVLIISASQIVYFRIKPKLSYMVWIVRTCRVLLVGFSSMTMMFHVLFPLFFLLSWVSEPIL